MVSSANLAIAFLGILCENTRIRNLYSYPEIGIEETSQRHCREGPGPPTYIPAASCNLAFDDCRWTTRGTILGSSIKPKLHFCICAVRYLLPPLQITVSLEGRYYRTCQIAHMPALGLWLRRTRSLGDPLRESNKKKGDNVLWWLSTHVPRIYSRQPAGIFGFSSFFEVYRPVHDLP